METTLAIDELMIKKLWYTHTHTHTHNVIFSGKRKKKVTLMTTWIDFEGIVLSEMSDVCSVMADSL